MAFVWQSIIAMLTNILSVIVTRPQTLLTSYKRWDGQSSLVFSTPNRGIGKFRFGKNINGLQHSYVMQDFLSSQECRLDSNPLVILFRAMTQVLHPVRSFTEPFVDDMAVISMNWNDHLEHLEKFLQTV